MPRFRLNDPYLREVLQTLAERDDDVSKALSRFGPPTARRRPPGFATLVRALTAQQLSGKAAATIYGRLADHFGPELDPAKVARSRVPTLRRLGLSQRKAESLIGLARATARGELAIEGFGRCSDQTVIEQIAGLKGFGPWSAQMYLIFSLGRPDVWPVDDLGVRKGMQHVLSMSVLPLPRALGEIGERYAPHRSAMALFAWHVQNSLQRA